MYSAKRRSSEHDRNPSWLASRSLKAARTALSQSASLPWNGDRERDRQGLRVRRGSAIEVFDPNSSKPMLFAESTLIPCNCSASLWKCFRHWCTMMTTVTSMPTPPAVKPATTPEPWAACGASSTALAMGSIALEDVVIVVVVAVSVVVVAVTVVVEDIVADEVDVVMVNDVKVNVAEVDVMEVEVVEVLENVVLDVLDVLEVLESVVDDEVAVVEEVVVVVVVTD
mmetsp:Transcript_31845/g.91760  ORF Transcript_31845/g.91760 Transcript_31845/m.91760 type:complete len:226 (+) Transcript_31845:627-1304(+)